MGSLQPLQMANLEAYQPSNNGATECVSRMAGLRALRPGTLGVRGNSLSFGSYLVAGGNFGGWTQTQRRPLTC